MAPAAQLEWKTWTVAVAGALVLTGSVLSLFHFDPSPVSAGNPPDRLTTIGFLTISSSESELMDPTALFLPNKYNARPESIPADAIQRPGDTLLRAYPPKLSMGDTLSLSLPPTGPVPETPAEALALGSQTATFSGFGRSQVIAPQVSQHDPLVAVISLADGHMAWSARLSGAEIPPVPAAWKPLEFFVYVDRNGLPGYIEITSSSTFSAVDSYFQKYLENERRIGPRLDPGNYRIRIEP